MVHETSSIATILKIAGDDGRLLFRGHVL